jgi:carbon monoxide dehydrogenase subunit G
MKLENEFVVAAPIEQVWKHLLDVERIAPCAPGAELTEIVDERTWKGKVNVKIGPISMSFAGTVTIQERDDEGHRAVLKAEGREQKGKGSASALVVGHLQEAEGGTRVHMETDLTITGAVAQYGRGMIGDISARMTNDFAACLQVNMAAIGAAGVVAAPASGEAPAALPSGASASSVTATATGGAASIDESVPESRHDGPGGSAASPSTPAAATRPATRPAPSAMTPARAKPVKGFRLGLWALWRAVVRFFRRLFGLGNR